MTPIFLFHHGCFYLGDPPVLSHSAVAIACEQMKALQVSGLLDAAAEFNVGINGGFESRGLVGDIFPRKANVKYHGLRSQSENLTLVMIEQKVRSFPGEAYVFYEHQKGSSYPRHTPHGQFVGRWRHRMMRHLVYDWRQCVTDLDSGFECVGSHWRTGQCDGTQHYFAGNFWAARASFLRTLPSIYERARIKQSGIGALESRFEAEVVLGNGPRLPNVKSYYDGPLGT